MFPKALGVSASAYMREPSFKLGMMHIRYGNPPIFDAYRTPFAQAAYERGRMFALTGRKKTVKEFLKARANLEVL